MKMASILFLVVMVLQVAETCAATAQPAVTVVGERGNWCRKNQWLKEAQALNDQIQKQAQAAKKTRSTYATEREKSEKKVAEFYSSRGFARGKMSSLVADLKVDAAAEKERRIAAARKKSESDDTPLNFYDVQVEAIEEDVKRLEREFEQFNLDMKSIADLDASLLERIKTVDKYIKEASEAAKESNRRLEELWWIIDDQKAADSFYAVQGCADKTSSIKNYLEETLLADFKKVAQMLERQIDQVAKQVEALEQRGLVVAHRATRLAKKEVPDAPGTVADAGVQEEEPVTPRRRRAVAKLSLLDQVRSWLAMPFEWLFSWWNGAADAHGSASAEDAEAAHVEDAAIAPAAA